MIKKIFNKIIYLYELFTFVIFDSGYEKIGVRNHSVSSRLNYYISAVKKFTRSDRSFRNFKRSLLYREVLEHVDYELALKYMRLIENNYTNGINYETFNLIKDNDRVGNPKKFNFEIEFLDNGKKIERKISLSGPTTRYWFVWFDINKNIKLKNIKYIAEIGGGYGGQALIFDRLIKFKKYYIFDLPSVNKFSQKYLKNFYFNNSFCSQDINEFNEDKIYDLVISNYAFSELPRELQEIYLKKIILKSKSGYMIMNTGNDINFDEKTSRYSATELLKTINNSKIIEENPLSSNKNYIIIWENN